MHSNHFSTSDCYEGNDLSYMKYKMPRVKFRPFSLFPKALNVYNNLLYFCNALLDRVECWSSLRSNFDSTTTDFQSPKQ